MSRATCSSIVVIALVVVVAHSACLDGVFIFDDEHAIVLNPHLAEIGFEAPPQSSVSGRPLVALSLSLNHAWGGLDPWGYHCFNLVVHLLNAWLLALVLRRVFDRVSKRPDVLATLAATLWAVHPIQSEVVAYTTQRTESLAALFVLSSLVAMTLGIERHRKRWLALSVVLALLGLAAKESAAVTPVLAILLDRSTFARSWTELWSRRRGFHGAMLATWGIAIVLVAQGHRSESVGFGLGTSAWTYLLAQSHAIVDYGRLLIWPIGQTIDYGVVRPVAVADVWLKAASIIVVVVSSILVTKRWPGIGLWGLWVFVCLGPTSTFVPIVTEVAAERRMYLALIGVVVLFVIGLNAIGRKLSSGIALPMAVLVILIGVCGWLTHMREAMYHDAVELWRDATVQRPENERAHGNLAAVLASEGRFAEARIEYEEALRIDPSYADPKLYLGILLASQGEFLAATDHLRWAADRHPRRTLASFWAGVAHERLRGYRSAIRYYLAVLEAEPKHPNACNNLAWLLATCPDPSLRDPDRAYSLIEPAYRAQPEIGELRDTYAACLAANGRFDLARPVARELVRDASRLVARDPSYRPLAAMLTERLESYRRSESWIDDSSHGVTRFQGGLRNLSLRDRKVGWK